MKIIKIEEKILNNLKILFNTRPLKLITFFIAFNAAIFLYAAPLELPYSFQSGELIYASRINENFKVLQNKINVIEAQIGGVPVGTILPYAGPNIPAGWLICDGRAMDATTENERYAELFTAIGTSWGGDTNANFRLPDLRGRFLRGVDTNKLVDPDADARTNLHNGGNIGAAVGTYQGDAFQSHKHFSTHNGRHLPDYDNGDLVMSLSTNEPKFHGGTTVPINDGTNGEPKLSSETRPSNAAVYYIIKAYN